LRSNMAPGKFRLHDFVIMPDHLHLLMTLPSDMTIEKAMQLIKGGFSYRLKKSTDLGERFGNVDFPRSASTIEKAGRTSENISRRTLLKQDWSIFPSSIPTATVFFGYWSGLGTLLGPRHVFGQKKGAGFKERV
jgi:Transposase IS200 like